MSDLWGDVRRDVMRRLEEYAPTVPFEDRVRIAEDAACEVKLDAELFVVPNRTIGASVIHAVPNTSSGITACCGRTPFELPRGDRLTEDHAAVTCTNRHEEG